MLKFKSRKNPHIMTFFDNAIEKFAFGGLLETNAPKLINASLSPFSTRRGGGAKKMSLNC